MFLGRDSDGNIFFYPVVFNCSSLSNVILNIKYTVEQNVLEIILFHSASLKQFLASLFIFKAEGLFSFGGCFFFLKNYSPCVPYGLQGNYLL